MGESIINAANKVIDFEQFKREQEKMLEEYNDQFMNDAKTINYVDDIHLDDLRENKNWKIATKKISDKYKKIRRKRKAAISVPSLHTMNETLVLTDQKVKKQRDKAALIAAKKNIKKI